MIEKFEYSNTLLQEIKTERRKRTIFFIILSLPFWIFAFLVIDDYIGILCAIGFTCLLFWLSFLLSKFERNTISLIGQTIVVRDKHIQQINKNGNILCEINLDEKFQIGYPYHAWGNAIYYIKQHQNKLIFSSRINNAERLVKDILGNDEWPPGDNQST